ncbi:MAG: pitrilysin family protein [Cyanobacteria bacterium P01_G01_bin.49]
MLSTALEPLSLNAPSISHLANGLTIIAEQMPVEAINLNLWLKVGSAIETDEINGMAHFLEHMVFKGTTNLKSGEFERLIEERGAVTNAGTSQEYTHFYVTSAPSDFAQLAPLQLDVVLNPSIPDQAFERERLVVLEEIRRSYDNPRRRSFYRAMEVCFERLPYRRPVLGPASVIEQLTPQQMRDFHHSYYQPKSVTAVVVGNLPVETLTNLVAESFEKTYTPTFPMSDYFGTFAQEFSPEPAFAKIVRQDDGDNRLQQARLVMMWRVPGLVKLQNTYELDVLAAILGKGKVSRLFRDLREERGLVSNVSVSNMTQGIQGMFYVAAQLPSENIEEVEKIVAQHISKIQQESVSKIELARIQRQVANQFIFSNERPSSRANLYGYYHSQLQDLNPALNYPQIIQSLTLENIQAAAQQYLSPDAYGITVVRPTS